MGMMNRFCKFCQEILDSKLCPFCERPTADFEYSFGGYEPEVDDGERELDFSNLGTQSFEDLFGAEDD